VERCASSFGADASQIESRDDPALKAAVVESQWRHHQDLSEAVAFDAVIERGEERVRQEIQPPLAVEAMLVVDRGETGEGFSPSGTRSREQPGG